jgi:hypothetical protein
MLQLIYLDQNIVQLMEIHRHDIAWELSFNAPVSTSNTPAVAEVAKLTRCIFDLSAASTTSTSPVSRVPFISDILTCSA